MKNYKKIPLSLSNTFLGLYPVYSDEIYLGREPFRIVGVREKEVEIQGDFSGGTHNVSQKDWISIDKLFTVKSLCEQELKPNGCQIHNVNCCGGGNVINSHTKYWENLIE